MTVSYPPLEIVFEDDALVALVKPSGLPTANAEAGQESVYTLLKRRRPVGAFIGIVSRLDAPVSGAVVVAKTPAAAASLAAQFRARTVSKHYLAVLTGRFPAPLETWLDWRDWMQRQPGHARSTIVERPPPPGGGRDSQTASPPTDIAPKEAHVRARVLRRTGEVSLAELEPSTGRRHQLRVQLASRGCPIVGDRLYGSRLPFPDGIALHASKLLLAHPLTAEPLDIRAPLPDTWRRRFPALLPPQGEAGPRRR